MKSFYFKPGIFLAALFLTLSVTANCVRAFPADFDGDGKSDLVVYRPTGAGGSNSRWYVFTSGGTCPSPLQTTGSGGCFCDWGLSGDIPISGDYDGDHRADFTVVRKPSYMWYIKFSSNGGTVAVQFGIPGTSGVTLDDLPDEGDINNDGLSDIMVFRPEVQPGYMPYYVRYYDPVNGVSVAEYQINTFGFSVWSGISGATADYDTGFQGGEPGIFYRYFSGAFSRKAWQWATAATYGSQVQTSTQDELVGVGNFVTVSSPSSPFADWTTFRPLTGNWDTGISPNGNISTQNWGLSTDVPVPGDFDGDGLTDLAVWRNDATATYPWTWFVKASSGFCPGYMTAFFGTSYCLKQWGLAGDIPVS